MILLNANPFNEEIIADPVDSVFVERDVTILFVALKVPVAKDPDVRDPMTVAFCATYKLLVFNRFETSILTASRVVVEIFPVESEANPERESTLSVETVRL